MSLVELSVHRSRVLGGFEQLFHEPAGNALFLTSSTRFCGHTRSNSEGLHGPVLEDTSLGNADCLFTSLALFEVSTRHYRKQKLMSCFHLVRKPSKRGTSHPFQFERSYCMAWPQTKELRWTPAASYWPLLPRQSTWDSNASDICLTISNQASTGNVILPVHLFWLK